jgi:putative IMPACT (imprinted ancient) family translation regulator
MSTTLKSGRVWYKSEVSISKNSKFLGHVTQLKDESDSDNIQSIIKELIESDKSIQKSTHPAMSAWIKKQFSGITNQGINDCGESGAGIKLMYLLQKSETVDVLVVVTRWYGGVPLGSSRFRYICNAAMEAMRNAGVVKENGSSRHTKGKKRK